MRRFSNRSTKMEFPTFRGQFGVLNATICWFILHKVFTIEKYEVSAFTGKKINVMWPKLIEIERNENLKLFHFFKKNQHFFKFWKSTEKTAPGAVFFWKVHSTSKLFRIASNHFQNFLKVSLERFDFTLNDFETLNATI